MLISLHELATTTPKTRVAFMDRLFERIEDEPCMRGRADTPPDDPPGIGVDG